MSQFPPAPPAGSSVPDYNPQPQQGNIAAVLSLITGILGCIPGIGIVAIILGIFGIKKANRPNTGGRGLAIAGIIFGVIGLIWTGVVLLGGVAGLGIWKAGAPARDAAKQFVTDVAGGNADAAIKDCASTIDADKVRAAVTDAQTWGALKDTTFFSVAINDSNGSKSGTVAGLATFANAKKVVNATLTKEGDSYKVSDFTFADQK